MNTDLTKMTLRALIVKKHTLMSKSPVTAEHIREFKALDRELNRRAMNKWRETTIKKY